MLLIPIHHLFGSFPPFAVGVLGVELRWCWLEIEQHPGRSGLCHNLASLAHLP